MLGVDRGRPAALKDEGGEEECTAAAAASAAPIGLGDTDLVEDDGPAESDTMLIGRAVPGTGGLGLRDMLRGVAIPLSKSDAPRLGELNPRLAAVDEPAAGAITLMSPSLVPVVVS